MTDWQDKKVTILGAARSGIAAAKYLASRGAQVFVSEQAACQGEKLAPLEALKAHGVEFETGGHTDRALNFAELIVISPGISPDTPVVKSARKLGKKIISDIELASRESSATIIAITGTNGKSTTCALVSHILQGWGKKAPACGNIGVPILGLLEGKPDYLVVEVSSFQLAYSPKFAPKIAVWLNLTPDHLEWHGSLEEYIAAKQSVFDHLSADQFAVLNSCDEVVSKIKTQAQKVWFSTAGDASSATGPNAPVGAPREAPASATLAYLKDDSLHLRQHNKDEIICKASDLKILGKHNIENALAAIASCAVAGMNGKDIGTHLKTFTALEHRLEYVATIDGVEFYNDSKATNTASAIKALESFTDKKVVLIAGGRDKGTDLGEFVECVKTHASDVILIGEAKERFFAALKTGGFQNLHRAASLDEAIDLGGRMKRGAVLLSPACASFDMFKDYEERGRVFKDIVRTRLRNLAPSH